MHSSLVLLWNSTPGEGVIITATERGSLNWESGSGGFWIGSVPDCGPGVSGLHRVQEKNAILIFSPHCTESSSSSINIIKKHFFYPSRVVKSFAVIMGLTNFVLTVAGVSAVVLLLRSDVKQSANIFRRNVKHIRNWLEEETAASSKEMQKSAKELESKVPPKETPKEDKH
ncbi:uncharacterized protein DS421_12g384280 [Arachis hypogaea]|nr:uncharacterized protein DS421_12g384280 [Arachis hypogaea]